ncbi:MAG: MFS transporter [Mycoplasmatales bacterium]
MINKKINKVYSKVLSIYFIFNIARVLPHAILTSYLFSNGMSVGDIALIQISYMIAVILLEFPSGVLSDLWSRKYVFILGAFLVGISYALIPHIELVQGYCLLWFLYGVGMAFISGTLDNDVILYFKKNKEDEFIPIFNTLLQKYFFISSFIGGIIGGYIYLNINSKIYIISFIIIMLSILITFTYNIKEDPNLEKENFKVSSFFKNILKDKNLIKVILFTLTLTIFTTIFFQFWQILFLEKCIDIKFFGISYGLFQIMGIVASKLYIHIYKKKYNISIIYIILLSLIFLITLSNDLMFFLFFLLMIMSFYIIQNHTMGVYKKEISSKNISASTSLLGSMQSIFSILILILIYVLSRFLNVDNIFLILLLSFVFFNGLLLYIIEK